MVNPLNINQHNISNNIERSGNQELSFSSSIQSEHQVSNILNNNNFEYEDVKLIVDFCIENVAFFYEIVNCLDDGIKKIISGYSVSDEDIREKILKSNHVIYNICVKNERDFQPENIRIKDIAFMICANYFFSIAGESKYSVSLGIKSIRDFLENDNNILYLKELKNTLKNMQKPEGIPYMHNNMLDFLTQYKPINENRFPEIPPLNILNKIYPLDYFIEKNVNGESIFQEAVSEINEEKISKLFEDLLKFIKRDKISNEDLYKILSIKDSEGRSLLGLGIHKRNENFVKKYLEVISEISHCLPPENIIALLKSEPDIHAAMRYDYENIVLSYLDTVSKISDKIGTIEAFKLLKSERQSESIADIAAKPFMRGKNIINKYYHLTKKMSDYNIIEIVKDLINTEKYIVNNSGKTALKILKNLDKVDDNELIEYCIDNINVNNNNCNELVRQLLILFNSFPGKVIKSESLKEKILQCINYIVSNNLKNDIDIDSINELFRLFPDHINNYIDFCLFGGDNEKIIKIMKKPWLQNYLISRSESNNNIKDILINLILQMPSNIFVDKEDSRKLISDFKKIFSEEDKYQYILTEKKSSFRESDSYIQSIIILYENLGTKEINNLINSKEIFDNNDEVKKFFKAVSDEKNIHKLKIEYNEFIDLIKSSVCKNDSRIQILIDMNGIINKKKTSDLIKSDIDSLVDVQRKEYIKYIIDNREKIGIKSKEIIELVKYSNNNNLYIIDKIFDGEILSLYREKNISWRDTLSIAGFRRGAKILWNSFWKR